MNTAFIGTSGFSYSYWKNRFYPAGLPASKWLEYYSSVFNTVELNNTFYRFPIAKNLKKAADATPDDFRFSVKAHKIITHTMRMRQVKEKVKEFKDIVQEGLGDKLACILYQLPPSYSWSEERMNDILTNIVPDASAVIEFRNASWWNKDVCKLFKSSSLTFCSVSYPGLPEDNIVTSGTFYKRMHGVPELFKSAYAADQLTALAKDIPAKGNKFIYFNNTMFEAGYTNALALKELVGKKTSR